MAPPIGMPLEILFLIIIMLISGTLLMGLAVYSWRKEKEVIASHFTILMLLCALWAYLNILMFITPAIEEKVFVQNLEYICIIAIPPVLLLTILAYIGKKPSMGKWTNLMVFIIPIISMVMLLTNDHHHLFFQSNEMGVFRDLEVLENTAGPYYGVHFIYSYMLIFLSLALLALHALSVKGDYRTRDVIIAIGIGTPFFGDIASIIGLSPSPGLNWAPGLFVFMGIAMMYAIFRYCIFEVTPLARDLVWDNTPDPFVVLDQGNKVLDMNKAAETVFNVKLKDITGLPLTRLLDSEPQFKEMENGSFEGRKEIPLVWEKGDVRTYEMELLPINDRKGKSMGKLLLLRDVTSHKALNDIAQQSERKYRLLMDSAPLPLVVIKANDNTITFLNSGMESLLATSKEKAIGCNLANFLVDPADEMKIKAVLLRELKIDNYELGMLNARKKPFWVYLSAIPLILEGEDMFIVAVHDISDRKMAEALRSANDKLNLLYGITRHDLLNKFGLIGGYLTVLKRTEDPQARSDLMRKLEINALAAQELIRFTHDYEKLGVSAPIWQSISKVFDKASSQLDLRGITVKNDSNGVEIFCDGMLEKVFYNLLENTLRHGGHVNSVRLSCEAAPESGIRIIYEDDGEGISYEDKKNLFKQGMGRNSGQGMFLTKEILSITSISIVEEGIPGRGVRFVIDVPRSMFHHENRAG